MAGGRRRERYRVVAVEVAEQHPAETIYRVKVRHADQMQPTYLHYVSQPAGKDAPYGVGSTCELDPRLVDQE
jgi:hypothetical protein